ncbi:MAG: M14 family metallocarboxypeptidase [Clostridia bacterium]|nr:M14 family metallocarboxypeptidase [Clostridia bacterium]
MEYIVNSKDYDYFERKRLINTLCNEYPFLNMKIIGRSCAGRDIHALRIGAANEYTLITAAFHGSERITSVVLLMFIERLCSAIAKNAHIAGLDAVKALHNRGIIFVPCVNPDGCEISLMGAAACGALSGTIGRLCRNDFTHWNANLRGVDINHNFNAGWEELRNLERKEGIFGPSPTRFGGYKPESEPETLALTELCRTRRIRHVTALHSQGEVIYWTYGEKRPPRSRRMAEIMATSSGYALDYPTRLASGGGFKDWFISEFNRPGFTVELGLGQNPLPPEQAQSIYKRVEEMLMLCCIM